MNITLAEVDICLAEANISLVEANISLAEANISLVFANTSLAEVNISLSMAKIILGGRMLVCRRQKLVWPITRLFPFELSYACQLPSFQRSRTFFHVYEQALMKHPEDTAHPCAVLSKWAVFFNFSHIVVAHVAPRKSSCCKISP